MCGQRKFRSACAFEQSDQYFHWLHFEKPEMRSFFTRTTKTLIRLRRCAGWFESTLGEYVRRYVFSPLGSIYSNKTSRIISCNARKCTLCALRPAQTHTSLRVCGGPKTRGFFWRKMKTLIRLRGFTLWSESSLGLYFIWCIFLRFDNP